MRGITPCLWFDHQAEEAANFYVSLFRDARIVTVTRHGEAAAKANNQPEGSVLVIAFRLLGQEFLALNGGPTFKLTPAISLIVNCETQEEVDTLWDKLSAGGKTNQCGWLTDKYGVSWQITPTVLPEMLADPDPRKSERVMQAMLQMTKLDIARLRQAYAGT